MSEHESLVGSTLGGLYRIDREIGAGGFGAVYEAVNLKLGRRVAVKVLLDAADAKLRARFEQEARAMADLASPNIVTVIDFHAAPDAPAFLVMELLEGESLRARMQPGKGLPAREAARMAMQIFGALAVAHRAGIVHRDVKPANVFLAKTSTGEDLVKLLDFGIAKVRADRAQLHTTTGILVGTPAYFAPEQLLARDLDGRTDVFAAGVVLYEMLAGHRPWDAKNPADLAAAILHAAPPPLAGVPSALAAAVSAALTKDREERPTAEQMLSLLGAFASSDGDRVQVLVHGGARPPARLSTSLQERPSRSALPWVAGLALVVGAVGAVAMGLQARASGAQTTIDLDALADAAPGDGADGASPDGAPLPDGDLSLAAIDAEPAAAADADPRAPPPEDDPNLVFRARYHALRQEYAEILELLEEKVRAGRGNEEEVRLVIAACKDMGDRTCAREIRALYQDAGATPAP